MSLVAREFYAARTNAGVSQAVVADRAGLSRPQYGRIERGIAPEVSLVMVARIAAVLGLDTALRFFPSSDPIRDVAHAALLERFHAICHPSLWWRTEVPFPGPGDRRAWDAVVGGMRGTGEAPRVRIGVEAETRPNDVQALDRKLALKERDGDVERVILLLSDTRHNRSFLRGPGASLRNRFPLDGRRALLHLAAASDPGSNAIVLL